MRQACHVAKNIVTQDREHCLTSRDVKDYFAIKITCFKIFFLQPTSPSPSPRTQSQRKGGRQGKRERERGREGGTCNLHFLRCRRWYREAVWMRVSSVIAAIQNDNADKSFVVSSD